jgi:ATP-dependent Lon protease
LEERLELLIKLPSKRQVEKEIDNEAKARIKSHQEKYILLEKLRIIKEKLKQLGGAKDKTQKILERLEKEPYPEYVKKVVQEEIKNYELMPSNSSEASMTKQYID